MSWFFTFYWIGSYVAAIVTIGTILRGRKEPMSMLSWILTILLFPLGGILLYLLMGSNRVRRRARRRRKRLSWLEKRLKEFATEKAEFPRNRPEPQLESDLESVERIGRRLTGLPATDGNSVRIYEEANATYAALEAAIRAAEHHIHLEYYIWNDDETGRYFRDLIVEKARQGVECRMLLDAAGCWRMGKSFTRPLTEAGVQVAFFLPFRPFRKRISPHLRNHRKIVVVDGATAFTGSQNIGDEYRGRLKRFSPWYDTHLEIRGPAALYLQQTFVEDWYFATRDDLSADACFPHTDRAGDSIVQVLPTGPDQDFEALVQLTFAGVSTARESIRIVTPYFVPHESMRTALLHASYRGVEVELLLTARSDAPVAKWAGRSFYSELIKAGVRIREFEGGMLHSKMMTIDDRCCLVGSANMDTRSFRLNFEITAMIYDRDVTAQLSRSILRRYGQSRTVELRDVENRSLPEQFIEGGARLLSPLL